MPRKICVVLTARTSYTKIKPILAALQAHDAIDLQLVCAASAVLDRYGNTDKMVERDGFDISERVYNVLEGETLLTSTKATGLGIVEFAGVFDRLKPDAVLVMADRYEILSAAVAASYQNIPLIHVQGGEVSGNIDEKVRHAVTKLADIHFPATKRSAENIIRMGENPDQVFHVGCPSIDIAKEVMENPDPDFDLYKKYGGVGSFPDLGKGYYIVMQHPVTTEVGNSRAQIMETLEAMKDSDRPVLWFWPNVDAGGDEVSKGIRIFREHNDLPHMHFIKNMAPKDFLTLLNNSCGIIGNSSVAIREASYLGVPAINVGSRQSARERGANVVDAPYERTAIRKLVQSHLGTDRYPTTLYGDGTASLKIANHIATTPLTYSKTLTYMLDTPAP
ncbi:MAG: UDP-N-acetylglucosamine 2-epimerase (hydrolyzing) [Alphaproteobacteria bacterium]|mgnify:CR=1 FL=1|nr:UDP-N-acetylglucosamine 2-epimerase (hydrolyzing) [Alphaproteobacteria bacterium]